MERTAGWWWLVAVGVAVGMGGLGVVSDAEQAEDGALYQAQPGVDTRWVSFENRTGARGAGGEVNQGAKGSAFDFLKAGEKKVLLDVAGSGTIRRFWMTLRPQGAKLLRALRLDMYWDQAETPAVSVPVGDFFGWILGEPASFESEFFSSPEGRSFNCVIPMPFRTGARVTLTNESAVDLSHVFYDIDLTINDVYDAADLYFHASWRRERWTSLGEDFAILPKVIGEGRFLGCHIGVIANPQYKGWWGEGEVKIYLDGDGDLPTLVGTGTEDYIGTAWGQGTYAHRFQGCLVSDEKTGRFTFYRYHVPDPVYFHMDCHATIQQIGGAQKGEVIKMQQDGVPLKPVSINNDKSFTRLLDMTPPPALDDPSLPDGWTNFYRQDDVSAVAFFYLDTPGGATPPLASVERRTEAMD